VSRNLRCATRVGRESEETCYIITWIKDIANDVVESVKIEKTIYYYDNADVRWETVEVVINSFGDTEIAVYKTTVENYVADRELICYIVVDADINDIMEELSNVKSVVQLRKILGELRRRLRIF
jgi:hypothetical protein